MSRIASHTCPRRRPRADKAVVRPNVDTLYATTFLDLTAEPVVIHVPGYARPLLRDADARREHQRLRVARASARRAPMPATSSSSGRAGTTRFSSPPEWPRSTRPTNLAWVINRTQLEGDKDIDAVNDIQQAARDRPAERVAEGRGQGRPDEMAESAGRPRPPRSRAWTRRTYFNKTGAPPARQPPSGGGGGGPEALRHDRARPRPAVQPEPESRAHSREGESSGALESIREKAPTLGEGVNGWRIMTKTIGTYGTDYLQRAAVTQFALGANLPARRRVPERRRRRVRPAAQGRQAVRACTSARTSSHPSTRSGR